MDKWVAVEKPYVFKSTPRPTARDPYVVHAEQITVSLPPAPVLLYTFVAGLQKAVDLDKYKNF